MKINIYWYKEQISNIENHNKMKIFYDLNIQYLVI